MQKASSRRVQVLHCQLAAAAVVPTVEELREKYGTAATDGVVLEGVNHCAWVCQDMDRTVRFWCGVLGLQLTKTIMLPDGGQHFFMSAGRGSSVAYFWFPNAPPSAPAVASVDIEKMYTTGDFSTAHGSVNHVAFNVSLDRLRGYRKKVQKIAGDAEQGFEKVMCTPMLFHTDDNETGFEAKRSPGTTWESFYFTGPDGEYLEMTAQTTREFTPERDIAHMPKTASDASQE